MNYSVMVLMVYLIIAHHQCKTNKHLHKVMYTQSKWNCFCCLQFKLYLVHYKQFHFHCGQIIIFYHKIIHIGFKIKLLIFNIFNFADMNNFIHHFIPTL